MRYLTGLILALTMFVTVGCDEVPPGVTPTGTCQDSVRILTPNPAASATANEHICSRGAKLKVTDKDQSIVALCRCPDATPAASVSPDAGAPEEKK